MTRARRSRSPRASRSARASSRCEPPPRSGRNGSRRRTASRPGTGAAPPKAGRPASARGGRAGLRLGRVAGLLPAVPAADEDAHPGAPVVERPQGDLHAGRLARPVAVEDELPALGQALDLALELHRVDAEGPLDLAVGLAPAELADVHRLYRIAHPERRSEINRLPSGHVVPRHRYLPGRPPGRYQPSPGPTRSSTAAAWPFGRTP